MKKGAANFSDVIRPVRRILCVIVAACSLLVLAPLTLLSFSARTWSGRLAGFAAICAIVGVIAMFVAIRAPNRHLGHLLAMTLPTTAFIVLVLIVISRTPSRISSESTGLISVFPDPSARSQYSIWNAIPEVDAVSLGTSILTRLDPFMSRAHARRIRHILNDMYDELETHHATRDLATVADMAVAELVGSYFRDRVHYYAYIPKHDENERLGMLVFLHGNAGNLKVMAWSWKAFADRNNVVIVCPTFGFGFWNEGGALAVERVYQHAVTTLPIDVSRVWLGGISDGGKGVTRSATAHPEHYSGLIYVSPTMIMPELADRRFLESWNGRPVLVFQGESDHNVLKRDVDPAVELMRSGGIDVRYQCFADEDHFLFFARREEVFQVIAPYFEALRQNLWVHDSGVNQP